LSPLPDALFPWRAGPFQTDAQRPLHLRETFRESCRESSFSDGEQIIGKVSASPCVTSVGYKHKPPPTLHCLPGNTGGCRPADCCGQGHDPVTPGRTSVLRAQESPKGVSDDPQRYIWAACFRSSPCATPPRALEPAGLHPSDGAPVGAHANPTPFRSTKKASGPPGARTRGREDAGPEHPPPLVSRDTKNILRTTSRTVLSAVSGRMQAASDRGDYADSTEVPRMDKANVSE
uniref:Uncharacterized protein n=1 Tax=Mustela putorius furo TaxID=9669 RepID=M3Z396_MUSPF